MIIHKKKKKNGLIESDIIEILYQLNANCKYFVTTETFSF